MEGRMMGITSWDLLKSFTGCGIVTQYTILGTTEQNGVAESENKTLMDMVRSMMSTCYLPESLWVEVLKT